MFGEGREAVGRLLGLHRDGRYLLSRASRLFLNGIAEQHHSITAFQGCIIARRVLEDSCLAHSLLTCTHLQ
jgi:hypothetical protein